MKEIKRIFSVKEAKRLRRYLLGKKFNFRNRFGGYEEAIHYTTNVRVKVHFLFSSYPREAGMIQVKMHIDNIYEKHHRLSTNPEDYKRVLGWLSLPSELEFDLTGTFSTAKERWVAKRFRSRSSLGGE